MCIRDRRLYKPETYRNPGCFGKGNIPRNKGSSFNAGGRSVETQFKRILAHKIRVAREIMSGLVEAGQMKATAGEIALLAENMALVATYWLSFEFARNPRAAQDGHGLGRGVFQVMALAAPYLSPRERELLDQLATRYAH